MFNAHNLHAISKLNTSQNEWSRRNFIDFSSFTHKRTHTYTPEKPRYYVIFNNLMWEKNVKTQNLIKKKSVHTSTHTSTPSTLPNNFH